MSTSGGASFTKKPTGVLLKRPKAPNAPAKSSWNVPRIELTHQNGGKSFVVVPQLHENLDRPSSKGRLTQAEVTRTAHNMASIMESSQKNHAAMTEPKHAQNGRQPASHTSRQNLNMPGGIFEKAGLNTTAALVRTTSGTSRAKGLVARAQAMPAQNDNVSSNVRNSMRTFTASPRLEIESCSDPTRERVVNSHRVNIMKNETPRHFPAQRGVRTVSSSTFYGERACPGGSKKFQPLRFKTVQKAEEKAHIDLTLDSDEEKAESSPKRRRSPSCKEEDSDEDIFSGDVGRRVRGKRDGSELTRKDLLAITGSTDSSISMEDTVQISTAPREEIVDMSADQDHGVCEFLCRHFVGADEEMRQQCTKQQHSEEKQHKSGILGTISGGGMGIFDLTAADLKCLKASEWLNDEVINAYMSLLSLRSMLRWSRYSQEQLKDSDGKGRLKVDGATEDEEDDAEQDIMNDSDQEEPKGDNLGGSQSQRRTRRFERQERTARLSDSDRDSRNTAGEHRDGREEVHKVPKRCSFFSSFFYALLRNAKSGYTYENVRRWSRNKELEVMDIIFFPINISNAHWCLAAVYPKEKKIRYFDSLGAMNSKCVDLLERYMQDEGKARGVDAWTGKWQKEYAKPSQDFPKQLDGTSCGVFVCSFADCISVGADLLSFKQDDMRDIRREVYKFMTACRM